MSRQYHHSVLNTCDRSSRPYFITGVPKIGQNILSGELKYLIFYDEEFNQGLYSLHRWEALFMKDFNTAQEIADRLNQVKKENEMNSSEDSIVFARMVVYPILVFVIFLITILGGCFITGEMDPMAWPSAARALALFVTLCLSLFGALAVEVNELPKIVAKTFRTPPK